MTLQDTTPLDAIRFPEIADAPVNSPEWSLLPSDLQAFIVNAVTVAQQGLNMRDSTMAMQWLSTTFLASMVYTARTYANSIGRSDQQEYLEKRLSVEAIAAGGIQNSNFFSLLAPAIDTAMKATGNDPIFISRNTQQASDIWGGVPTVDLYNSVSEGLAAAFQAGTKGGLSQSDVRSMLRVLPFQNAMGVTQMFNGMVRGLPEWSSRD